MKELNEEQLTYIKELIRKNPSLQILGFGTYENSLTSYVPTNLVTLPVDDGNFDGRQVALRQCTNPDGVYLFDTYSSKQESDKLRDKKFIMTDQLRSIFETPLKSRTLIL